MHTDHKPRVNTSRNHTGKLAIFKFTHSQWCVQEGCSENPPLALSPTDRRQSFFLGEMNRAKALKPSRTRCRAASWGQTSWFKQNLKKHWAKSNSKYGLWLPAKPSGLHMPGEIHRMRTTGEYRWRAAETNFPGDFNSHSSLPTTVPGQGSGIRYMVRAKTRNINHMWTLQEDFA